jgi:hypothetical protein
MDRAGIVYLSRRGATDDDVGCRISEIRPGGL